ncbi:MAG: ATP-binding domain-containing protein, partial [Clostridiales bacterium]|nr:ATP-binding domain-containing protein [Clostridiales bacterium]
MVPQYVSQWWLMTQARVFAFGDFCQIPEVSTAETKRELAGFQHDLKIPQTNYVSGYGVKVLKKLAHQHLETVLRSDNEIALLCDDLRDFTKTKSDIVKTIRDWSEKTDNVQYSTSLEDLETDPSWQIIAYTNKMCSYINNQLCVGGDYPDLSDKIILFDNLNPLKMYNGDVLMFGDFLQNIARYNNPKQKRRIYVCMKWDGKMPRKDSPNPIERNFFNIYIQFKQALDEVNSRRMYGLASIIEASGRAEGQIKGWLEDIEIMRKEEPHNGKCFQNIVEKFYEIDRDMGQYIADMSEPVPQLYVVNCGYGFAITCHKSQGSEFPNVCYLLEKFDKPLLYTGISRAKKKVKVIN